MSNDKEEKLDDSKRNQDKTPTAQTVSVEHPKKGKQTKKWKEYFLEFFMLFLAVSLGFFAENIREKRSENAKEIEYIVSMIEDLETDKSNLKKAILANNSRIKHLDSLAFFSINYNDSLNYDASMYKHYGYALKHPIFISPTERTMQQLKNAGGMRLIRKKTAIQAIVEYDANTKKLNNQQMYYERYQNRSIDLGTRIFNFQKLLETFALKGKEIEHPDDYLKLINNEKIELIEFGNIISTYQGVASYYSYILEEMNEEATHLIQILKEEYEI